MNRCNVILYFLMTAVTHAVYAVRHIIDFGEEPHSLDVKNVAMVNSSVMYESISIRCPRSAGGTPLHMYPMSMEPEKPMMVYAWSCGQIQPVPIAHIIRHESRPDLVQVTTTDTGTQFELVLERGLMVRNKYAYFIIMCATMGIEIDNLFLTEIDKAFYRAEFWPYAPLFTNSMKERIKAYKLGAVKVGLNAIPAVTHGCGNVRSPLFSGITEFDSSAPVPTCIVDIMETKHVGFYCKGGFIYPTDCFSSLYNMDDGSVFTTNSLRFGASTSVHGDLLVATFHAERFNKPIEGYCTCNEVDESSGDIVETARIVIRNKLEYVFNITNMLMTNRVAPKMFPWYEVTLKQGSSLLLKFLPPVSYYSNGTTVKPKDSTEKPVYAVNMWPHDPSTNVRIIKRSYEFEITERPITQMLSGDAFKVDLSSFHKGEMTIQYLKGRPLSLLQGITLVYEWTLLHRRQPENRNITASILVRLIPNYDYQGDPGCSILGIDTFATAQYTPYFRSSEWNYQPKRIRHCQLLSESSRKLGIYCPPEYLLAPHGCHHFAYDATREHTVPLPEEATSRLDEDTGITYIHTSKNEDRKFTISCSCLDKQGIEVMRTDIMNHINMMYLSNASWLRPPISMIYVDHAKLVYTQNEEDDSVRRELNEIPLGKVQVTNTVTLEFGTTLKLMCAYVDAEKHVKKRKWQVTKLGSYKVTVKDMPNYLCLNWYGLRDNYDPATYRDRWFPMDYTKHFYHIDKANGSTTLIAKPYTEAMSTSHLGFNVHAETLHHSVCYTSLTIELPEFSIVVTKDNNAKYVTLSYVCGSISNPSEKTNSTDDAKPSTSASNTQSTSDSHTSSGEVAKLIAKTKPKLINGTEGRKMKIQDVVKVLVPVTDPYLHGCGITAPEDHFFRDDTTTLTDVQDKRIGCTVDLMQHKKAAFYCPLPYQTDPPACGMNVTSTSKDDIGGGSVPTHISVSRSRNFYIFTELKGLNLFKLQKNTPRVPFSCNCVTYTGVIVSTIRIT